MNKNIVYVAVFAVLCTLAGVVVGAGIAKKASLPWPCKDRPDFSERAESFMKHGPGEMGDKNFMRHGHRGPGGRDGKGLLQMFITKLDLNKEQQAKVKGIIEKSRQEIDEIGKNVRKSMMQIKEKGDKEIMEILNPEQQDKFKVMIDEFKKKCSSNAPEGNCGPMPMKDDGAPESELPPQPQSE